MGSKYSCFGRAASTAIILDRAWKGKRVKSGLDSKVVISLIENAMREGDPVIRFLGKIAARSANQTRQPRRGNVRN